MNCIDIKYSISTRASQSAEDEKEIFVEQQKISFRVRGSDPACFPCAERPKKIICTTDRQIFGTPCNDNERINTQGTLSRDEINLSDKLKRRSELEREEED